ncbi:membrane protein [Clostridioides difficile]|nr:membrane protein [Clostridioides difficile]
MSKRQIGIKSTLISETLAVAYCLGATFVNKYFLEGSDIEYIPIIFLVVAVVCQWIYDQKNDDLVDEASKYILSRVNGIAIKVLFYSMVIISVCLATLDINVSNLNLGMFLLVILFIQSLLKLFLFIYFDRRGIYN